MNYNLKYTPEFCNKKDNVFVEEFFTGVDVKIFIDGVEADFISYLTYSVNENVQPLYGYNSYTFDDVAIGNRIVFGNVLIPIKNYDTEIIDFTVTTDKKPTLQKEDAWNDSSTWYDKPSWIKNERYNITKDSQTQVIVRNDDYLREVNATGGEHFDKGKLDSNEGIEGKSSHYSYLGSDDKYYRKPIFKRHEKSYFNEWYSDKEKTINFIKAKLQDNYIDLEIKINNKTRTIIECVVFKTSETTYNSNDEPIYESVSFIARNVTHIN